MRTSGRSIVIFAMPSAVSYRTSVYDPDSGPGDLGCHEGSLLERTLERSWVAYRTWRAPGTSALGPGRRGRRAAAAGRRLARHRRRDLGGGRRDPARGPSAPARGGGGPPGAAEADPRSSTAEARAGWMAPRPDAASHSWSPPRGTGGDAELVQFARSAIDAAVASSALALEATPHDAWICCLPLAHVGGLLVLLRGLLLGAPVHILRRSSRAMSPPSGAPRSCRSSRRCSSVCSTPRPTSRHLRAILVGGAHLRPHDRERADRAGAPVVETYGLTESCGGVVYDGPRSRGRGAHRRRRRYRAARSDVMLGYRFDADATAAAFTQDGWLRPGDAGEIDRARTPARDRAHSTTSSTPAARRSGRTRSRPPCGRTRRSPRSGRRPPRSRVGAAGRRLGRPGRSSRTRPASRSSATFAGERLPPQGPARARAWRRAPADLDWQAPPAMRSPRMSAIDCPGIGRWMLTEMTDTRDVVDPRLRARRLHGGPLRRPRQPGAAGPEGPRGRRPAHAHHRRRELPGVPRRDPRPRAHGAMEKQAARFGAEIVARRRHPRRPVRAARSASGPATRSTGPRR